MPRLKHVLLIALYSAKFSARSGGIVVFFIATLVVGMVCAEAVFSLPSIAEAQMERAGGPRLTDKQIVDLVAKEFAPAASYFLADTPEQQDRAFDLLDSPARTANREQLEAQLEAAQTDDEKGALRAVIWANFLLRDQPALLSAIFLFLLLGAPFLAATGSFNQFAGDIGDRGLRYLLLRTERVNIFFGRFLATWLVCSAIYLPMLALVVSYAVGVRGYYDWAQALPYMFRCWLVMSLLSFAYIALCAWISGMMSGALISMTVCAVAVGGVPMVALIGGQFREGFTYFKYLQPWWVHLWFYHPDWLMFAAACAVTIGYGALYLLIGSWIFHRRDL